MMRFAVKRTELDEPVKWVSKSLPTRPPVQALLGMKLEVKDNILSLSAYDYEQSAISAISVEDGSVDGSVLVPGKLLADIIHSLPQDVVHFEVDGTRMKVNCGAAKFTLPTMQIELYPALPVTPTHVGTVSSSVLAEAVRQVAVAASKDDSIPMLTGVRLEISPDTDTAVLVATDRYRLSRRTLPFMAAAGAEASELLIPSKSLSDFARSMGSAENIILGAEPGSSSGQFSVSSDQRTATTRLLDGEFPKYKNLLPTEFAGETTVNVSALVGAVKRVNLVANGSNIPCRLTFGDNKILLEGGTSDNAEASESVEASCTGAGMPITIAFNFQYLLDGLNALGSSEAVFKLVSSTRPATISAPDDDEFLYLIMPMRA